MVKDELKKNLTHPTLATVAWLGGPCDPVAKPFDQCRRYSADGTLSKLSFLRRETERARLSPMKNLAPSFVHSSRCSVKSHGDRVPFSKRPSVILLYLTILVSRDSSFTSVLMDAVEGRSLFCRLVEMDCVELYSTANDSTLPPPPASFPGERSRELKEP